MRKFFHKVKGSFLKDKKNVISSEAEVTRKIEGHYSSFIYPVVAVLVWELLKEKALWDPIRLGRTSAVSAGLAAFISSVISDKAFNSRIRGADRFIDRHGLPLNIAKDLGLDFISYLTAYTALELLKEGLIF
jgi:hypothetical protein